MNDEPSAESPGAATGKVGEPAGAATVVPFEVAAARLSAIDAYHQCAKENIQTHGGMGFTWEFDCHLYYRRARALAVNLGNKWQWEDKLISALENRGEVLA